MSADTFELEGGAVEQLGDKIAERLLAEEQAIPRTISLAGIIALAAEQTDNLLFEWGRYDQSARQRSEADEIIKKIYDGRPINKATLNHRRRVVENLLILPRPNWSLGSWRPFRDLIAATNTVIGEDYVTEGFEVSRKPGLHPANDRHKTTANLTINAVTLVGDAKRQRLGESNGIYAIRTLRLNRDQSPELKLTRSDKKDVGEDEAYFVLDILVKAQEQLKKKMPKLKRRKK